jgi:hypothetical protein
MSISQRQALDVGGKGFGLDFGIEAVFSVVYIPYDLRMQRSE